MKNSLVAKLSVLIVSSRHKPCQALLRKLEQQEVFPDEVLLITTYSKTLDTALPIKRKVDAVSNIAVARNKLLKWSKNRWCLFIDDDVEIGRSTIKEFSSVTSCGANIIAADCEPVFENYFSKYTYQRIFHANSLHQYRVPFIHCMLTMFDKDFLYSNNLSFNKRLAILESVALTSQVAASGGILILNKEIKAKHAYPTNLKSFVKKINSYYSWYPTLYHIIKNDIFETGYPNLRKTFRNSFLFMYNSGLPFWFSPLRVLELTLLWYNFYWNRSKSNSK